ncbi:hypothetical protein Poly51_48020 [Rubripirellula tenax]|uniref:DUF4259 domain-containing protein n=1 Tax=Rubripirellula tenax TaxID=2528015 RepID=A0A5C6EJ98_9BACT|nr:DUF4259 domain-containing protein [Rubripirellula tenax]TWU48898.1 hypothetical protein Poly51_48020 [Rubripirellula tenax]
MGVWGPRTFDSDIACDWLEDLWDSDAIAFFDHCLDLTDHTSESGRVNQLGMLACVGVVCTAEMLRGLLFGAREGLPDSAHRWLEENQNLDVLVQSLVPDTIEALNRVLASESEMYLRWDDADDDIETWRLQIESLKQELRLRV